MRDDDGGHHPTATSCMYRNTAEDYSWYLKGRYVAELLSEGHTALPEVTAVAELLYSAATMARAELLRKDLIMNLLFITITTIPSVRSGYVKTNVP